VDAVKARLLKADVAKGRLPKADAAWIIKKKKK
jgi:hypothetical protein